MQRVQAQTGGLRSSLPGSEEEGSELVLM